MLKRLFCIVLLIPMLTVVCAAEEINLKKLNKKNWINIESANFNVISDAKASAAIEIVRELEDFKYFLALALGFEQKDLSEKVPIIAAKNKGTFAAFALPNNIAGVFFSWPEYMIFARCDRFKSSSEGGSSWGRSVVLHELVHLFMRNASLDFAVPAWFSEGIAEYFGSYIEKKDMVIIGSLGILENRLLALRDIDGQFEKVDCESLFKISKSDLKIWEEDSKKHKTFISKFYARSVAVVHYMYSDNTRLNQMYQYLHLLKKGVGVDDAFSQVFQMTYSKLDNEVYQYMSKWSLTGIAFRFGDGGVNFPEVKYQNNDITKQDAMGFLYAKMSILPGAYLGDGGKKALYYGLEEFYPGLADAVTRKQLLEKPDNTHLLFSTATGYETLARYSEALELYERVLLVDPTHAGALNNLAWLLVTSPDMALRDPQRAVPLAEKAVSLKRSAGYLDTLAEAHYAAGSYQKAIEIISEAIALDPEYEYLKEQLDKFTAAQEAT